MCVRISLVRYTLQSCARLHSQVRWGNRSTFSIFRSHRVPLSLFLAGIWTWVRVHWSCFRHALRAILRQELIYGWSKFSKTLGKCRALGRGRVGVGSFWLDIYMRLMRACLGSSTASALCLSSQDSWSCWTWLSACLGGGGGVILFFATP